MNIISLITHASKISGAVKRVTADVKQLESPEVLIKIEAAAPEVAVLIADISLQLRNIEEAVG